MNVVDQFAAYEKWYRKEYANPDDPDDVDEPLKLTPVPRLTLGNVPAAYKQLLKKRGYGTIRCGFADYTLLAPQHMQRERKACISWIDKETRERAKQRQKIDVTTMVPFLVAPDGTTWVVFAGTQPYDRVFLISHDYEQGERLAPFAGPLTFEKFFKHFFERARKGDSLNGSHEHRYGFGKRVSTR
jgi:hypothetical protein